MSRKPRAPFVSVTVASVVVGVAAASGACGPNPPALDCPSVRPTQGDPCDAHESCDYAAPGCEDSTSARVTATCSKGKWNLQSYGVSCNPPNPPPDDAGTTDTGDYGACPSTEPVVGSACASVARCSYENLCPLPGASGFERNVYRCTGSMWVFESTLESEIACPSSKPRDGEACGCAMYLPASCAYGCESAKCDGATQKWIVTSGGCDGGTD